MRSGELCSDPVLSSTCFMNLHHVLNICASGSS